MKLSWPLALLFTALLAGLCVSPVAVTVAVIGLLVWALIGPLQALQALLLAIIVKYLNPGLVHFGGEAGFLLWLVPLAAGVRVLPRLRTQHLRILAFVWAFALAAGILSLHSSPAVAISVMKLITFVWVISTVIVAYGSLASRQIETLTTWFWTLAITVIGLSALTRAVPGIAFLRNGLGLQGILNHPQALGIFTAPIAAILLARLALTRESIKLLDAIVLAGVWIVMIMTQARTAAVAAALGVLIALLTRLIRTRHSGVQAGIGKIAAVMACGGAMLVVALFTVSDLSGSVASFLLKRSDTQDVSDAFQQSRGGAILGQWQNFLSAPWAGHGFGVYADGYFPAGVVEFAGIPISAPVEKGFVPTAVLEETGVLGGTLFFLMLWACARDVWRNADLCWIAAFVTCLAVNIGEAVILSPGGIGLYLWVLIGLAITKAQTTMPHAEGMEVSRADSPRHFQNLMT